MKVLNGKKISHILKENNITVKDAAQKIGISYNNLSSILNGNSASSENTKQKIIDFFNNVYHISPEVLFSTEESDILIRLKLSKQPAKNEIAIIREDLEFIEKLISLLKFTDENLYMYDDYITEQIWDLYTEPFKGYDLYDWTLRRPDFLEMISNQNLNTYTKRLKFFESYEVSHLLFRGYNIHDTDSCYAILDAVQELGIKVICIPLHSLKLQSASIPFKDKYDRNQEAVIIINKNSCKSPESLIWNITKEFYNILFKAAEYVSISNFQIELENVNCEDSKFANDILFNSDTVSKFIKKNMKTLLYYFPSSDKGKYISLDKYCENGWVNLFSEIKKQFRVSYTNIIHHLFKMDFMNITALTNENDFTTFLFKAFNNYNKSFAEPAFRFIDNEPQITSLLHFRDHLEVCINCLKNHSEDTPQINEAFNNYKKIIDKLEYK